MRTSIYPVCSLLPNDLDVYILPYSTTFSPTTFRALVALSPGRIHLGHPRSFSLTCRLSCPSPLETVSRMRSSGEGWEAVRPALQVNWSAAQVFLPDSVHEGRVHRGEEEGEDSVGVNGGGGGGGESEGLLCRRTHTASARPRMPARLPARSPAAPGQSLSPLTAEGGKEGGGRLGPHVGRRRHHSIPIPSRPSAAAATEGQPLRGRTSSVRPFQSRPTDRKAGGRRRSGGSVSCLAEADAERGDDHEGARMATASVKWSGRRVRSEVDQMCCV